MRDLNCLYEMLVRPKGRTPADEYAHKGDIWIEGRSNSWYEIELINKSPNRVMVIVSVDGVGVVDGHPASYDSQGFVLNGHDTLRVPGWVNSDQSAAQFVFSDVKRSYADLMGQGGNAGVIGTAWFTEKIATPVAQLSNVWLNTPAYQSRAQGVSLTVGSQNFSNPLATGWGEHTSFPNQQTSFVKAHSSPQAVMVIRYDHADNLRAMGIRLKDRVTVSSSQAFPGNNTYCKPPPVWVTKR
jgi:hypothetical protein